MFIFLYTVFRNSSISDEHVFCVALHFTIGRDIVYRFIKELINNAIKYGVSKDIHLSLKVQSDIIIIEESNQVVEKVQSINYGRGLKSFQETLVAFDGDMELQIDNKQYNIRILLPIDWKLCYEDFIN